MIVITFISIIALTILGSFCLNYAFETENDKIIPIIFVFALFLFILSALAIQQCEKQGIEKFVNGEYTVEPYVRAVPKTK